MHLDNTIKHTILIALQHNALRISLNKKRRKDLLLRKQIDLRLSKRYRNCLRIQI